MHERMTGLTPEQMRALADRLGKQSDALGDYWDFVTANERRLLQDSADALRSAADQLEAVSELMDGMFDNGAVSVRAIRFALTRYGVNALPRRSEHEAETP